jgi:hypothetical protein
LKKGIRKILTGTFVPLDTCLLMGDPVQATEFRLLRTKKETAKDFPVST